MTVEDILSRFEGVRRSGSGWTARCSAHDDRSPSLRIAQGDQGVVLHCHAGCTPEAVVSAAGLTLADLFTAASSNGNEREAVYDYVAEEGKLLFQVVRLPGKKFRQRRPDGNGDYVWRLGSTRRVLYRLPIVLGAIKLGATIYVVEGEKDVHAIEAAGLTATCNPGGAGQWRAEYGESLRGADVVIVADKDDAGRQHAEQVRVALEPIAASVRVVEAREGKDAADHLEAGHGVCDFVATAEPELSPADVAGSASERPSRLTFLWGPDFVAQPLEHKPALLGAGRDVLLPVGGLALLYGDGGAGKSTLALHMLAHLASGQPWLGIPVERRLRVGIVENEGPMVPFVEKLRQFTETWDGPEFLSQVAVLNQPWGRFTLADDGLRAELRAFAIDQSLDLIVAGPLGRLGVEGAGSPAETRAFLDLLSEVGYQDDIAWWLLHHENKARQVSGDWKGHPDLTLRLVYEGKRRNKLTFEKVRWGDQGRDPMILEWLGVEEGIGYKILDTTTPNVDWLVLEGHCREYVEQNPGCSQRAVEQALGGKAAHIREALARLRREEQLEDRGSASRMALYIAGPTPVALFARTETA